MQAQVDLPPSIPLIEAALEGLVAVNVVLINAGLVAQSPLEAGVRYKCEPTGVEKWNHALRVKRLGWGDCEDLAAWQCAGMRIAGDDCHVRILRTGKKKFHAVVETSDGDIVDVCSDLGMRGSIDSLQLPDEVNVSGLPWLDAPRGNEYVGSSWVRRQAGKAFRAGRGGGQGGRPATPSTRAPSRWDPNRAAQNKVASRPYTPPMQTPLEPTTPTSQSMPMESTAMPMPMEDFGPTAEDSFDEPMDMESDEEEGDDGEELEALE